MQWEDKDGQWGRHAHSGEMVDRGKEGVVLYHTLAIFALLACWICR